MPPDSVREGEELILVRAGMWRLFIPVRHVLRIHPAALPSARPGAPPLPPVVTVDGALVPVAFAAALVGDAEVCLAPDHQLVDVGAGGRRGLLWIDAVEEVLPHAPAAAVGDGDTLVACWSGGDPPLPVLDVPRVLELLC